MSSLDIELQMNKPRTENKNGLTFKEWLNLAGIVFDLTVKNLFDAERNWRANVNPKKYRKNS